MEKHEKKTRRLADTLAQHFSGLIDRTCSKPGLDLTLSIVSYSNFRNLRNWDTLSQSSKRTQISRTRHINPSVPAALNWCILASEKQLHETEIS